MRSDLWFSVVMQSADTAQLQGQGEQQRISWVSAGSQVSVSHSASKLRGSCSWEWEIVDVHKVEGHGVRRLDGTVTFERRRKNISCMEKKKEGCVRPCWQVLKIPAKKLEQWHSYSFVCSVSWRMPTFKRNEIRVVPVEIEGKAIFTRSRDSTNRLENKKNTLWDKMGKINIKIV